MEHILEHISQDITQHATEHHTHHFSFLSHFRPCLLLTPSWLISPKAARLLVTIVMSSLRLSLRELITTSHHHALYQACLVQAPWKGKEVSKELAQMVVGNAKLMLWESSTSRSSTFPAIEPEHVNHWANLILQFLPEAVNSLVNRHLISLLLNKLLQFCYTNIYVKTKLYKVYWILHVLDPLSSSNPPSVQLALPVLCCSAFILQFIV